MTPAELRALAEGATPGPWEHGASNLVIAPHLRYDQETLVVANTGEVRRGSSQADARLIALAPDLARLCAELGEAATRYFAELDKDAEGAAQLDHMLPWRRRELELRAALAKLSELEP